MTKILNIIDSLGRGGGAEQLLLHSLPAQRPLGLVPEVCCLWSQDNDLQDELASLGVRVHSLGLRPGHRWLAHHVLPRLAKLIEERNPDIIHAHLFFSGCYLGLLPRRVTKGPRIVSLHNVDFDVWPARKLRARVVKAGATCPLSPPLRPLCSRESHRC